MSVPVITAAEMREWERATWSTGQTESAVTARVGQGLAGHAIALTRPSDMILLLAGKGHNGDDVRAMAEHLPGRVVEQIDVRDPGKACLVLAAALERRPALIMDGLFGIGLTRALNAEWLPLIRLVNESHVRVLAVDVPSGLDADTGQPLPESIRATVTVTVGAPKRGLLTTAAASFVGRLEVMDDVGFIPCPCAAEQQWTLPVDFQHWPPSRPTDGHKGTFGHVAIVAGSLGYHGAAVLAARGAQRAGSGLITVFPQPTVYEPVASQLQAVMVQPWREPFDFSKFSAVLFGPGLADDALPPEVRRILETLWRTSPAPLVADASALDWLPQTNAPRPGLRVITPHPGEAARLLGVTTAQLQQDRPAALRALSRRCDNAWVVLKGRHTLIGRAEGSLFVNSSGNDRLAQGGSGDLLAGYIAGWLAQRTMQSDPLMTLRAAVWEHGAAGDRLSRQRDNWIVEELAEELGATARV